MPRLHPAQGDGREKGGHHPQRASGQHHAQRVALADHSAWLQGGDFPQVPRNRGPDAGLVDGVGQAGERRLCRADVAVKLGDLSGKLGEAGGAVAVFGALVAFQTADRQAQGVGRSPLLVSVGPGAQELEPGRQTTSIQTHEDVCLLGRGPCCDLGLTVPGARLVQGHAGSLPFVLLGNLLGAEFLAARLALCRQGCEADARFFILQTRRCGIEFGEHLTGLDRTAYHQVGRDDPPRHWGGDGMHGLVDFQPGGLA